MSADKRAGEFFNQGKNDKEFSDLGHHNQIRSANVSQDESALNIEYNDKRNL